MDVYFSFSEIVYTIAERMKRFFLMKLETGCKKRRPYSMINIKNTIFATSTSENKQLSMQKLDLLAIKTEMNQDCLMRPSRLMFLVKFVWIPQFRLVNLQKKTRLSRELAQKLLKSHKCHVYKLTQELGDANKDRCIAYCEIMKPG